MWASSLTHLWDGANKMIYLTFFHSLFWLNTMKEKGGGITDFLILQWADVFNHAKELHHHVSEQKKSTWFSHFFCCLPPLLRDEMGPENSKEGHEHYQSLLAWRNTRHSKQHVESPLGTALLVYPKFWPNAGTFMFSETSVLWALVTG